MKDLLNENEVELNEAEQQEVEEAEKEIEATVQATSI